MTKQQPFPSLLNNHWRYIPAAKTDIRKTFARIRAEQRAAEQQKAQPK
jgi:hypothetical protein